MADLKKQFSSEAITKGFESYPEMIKDRLTRMMAETTKLKKMHMIHTGQ